MEEESTDKLLGLEDHGLLAVVVRVISPAEGNLTVPDGEEAVIADGDSVGISTQVLQDPPGASERRFAVDHPFFMVERPDEGFEVSGILEQAELAGKDQLPALKVLLDEAQELTSEQRRQDLDGEEKPFTARYPTTFVSG
jgi:hypothetical protein